MLQRVTEQNMAVQTVALQLLEIKKQFCKLNRECRFKYMKL